MWRWIRVGLTGVVIGLLGGAMYVGLGTVKKLYSVGQSMQQLMDVMETDTSGLTDAENRGDVSDESSEQADQMKTAFQVLDASSDDDALGSSLKKLEDYYDSMLASLDEKTEDIDSVIAADETKGQETVDAASKVIRLQVVYNGTEELTEQEEQKLVDCARQAALYGIADKLGKDYNEQEKSAVRSELIMSLETINACAEEAAEEYGVEVTASSRFEYLYLPEAAVGDTTYPAGYYETLCITLK